MHLPFTVEQFYAVFGSYNEAVWPAQWLLFALALAAVILLFVPRRWNARAISAILAGLWAWMAVAYHFAFFARINPLAYAFGVASLMGAWMFVWDGVILGRLRFALRRRATDWIGVALIVFALAIYPAWSMLAGHDYPLMPTFGLPCPTTIFTIGMLAFRTPPFPRGPLVIPVLWSLIGGTAAFQLDVRQDLGLVVAGIAGLVMLLQRKWQGVQRAPI